MTDRNYFPVSAEANIEIQEGATHARYLLATIIGLADPSLRPLIYDLEEIISNILVETT